jgi:hypothetical protein
MHSISGARLHLLDFLGSDKTQEQLRTHSTIKMTLQFERKYSTQGSGLRACVLRFFLRISRDNLGRTSDWPSTWIYDSTKGSRATFRMQCNSSNHIFHMVSSLRQGEYHWRPSREKLEDAWELLGNSGKPSHPRNVEFDKSREMSFQDD